MPNPSRLDQRHPAFLAIFDCIKSWDIGVPESYGGYCGANGSHVKAIMNALYRKAYPTDSYATHVTGMAEMDPRDWPRLPLRWYRWQRFVDAWQCLTGQCTFHHAYQVGLDQGRMMEYHRCVVMGGK